MLTKINLEELDFKEEKEKWLFDYDGAMNPCMELRYFEEFLICKLFQTPRKEKEIRKVSVSLKGYGENKIRRILTMISVVKGIEFFYMTGPEIARVIDFI